jgi:hypothetical protein
MHVKYTQNIEIILSVARERVLLSFSPLSSLIYLQQHVLYRTHLTKTEMYTEVDTKLTAGILFILQASIAYRFLLCL